MNRDNDFQQRMADGKANAQRDRDRGMGGGTVRVFNTTAALIHSLGRIEPDNFDLWLEKVRGRVAEINAAWDHRINGHKWEGFE